MRRYQIAPYRSHTDDDALVANANETQPTAARAGHVIGEQDMSYLAEAYADCALTPPQKATCVHRVGTGGQRPGR